MKRVRVIAPGSCFRGREGDVLQRHFDGAVSVRLDRVDLPMLFGADEVEEIGANGKEGGTR